MAKIRILSIDGGGIRGIIPGTILQVMEEKIQARTGNPQARLVDYFDFLSGTSTGGILVCGMLAPASKGSPRPKYFVKDIVERFHEKGGEIFRMNLLRKIGNLWGLRDEKYSNRALKESLAEQFGDFRMRELIKPCLLTAYEIEARRAMFITQHDAVRYPYMDFLVRDAVLATCAAPTYFEPVRIAAAKGDAHVLIDGGVFANNPGMCAYAEARKLTFGNISHPTSEDMLLLSLGTGHVDEGYSFTEARNFGLVKWIRPLISMMMSGNSETVSHQLKWLFDAGRNAEGYFRIEPELLNARVQLDDASKKNMAALREAALRYVEKNESQIDDIVKKLFVNDKL